MAKVILICGKLCSGKTTYARQLVQKSNAVLLSIDEMMLSLFGPDAGDKHDEYAARCREYLLAQSIVFCSAGIDVVLDWGFWTHQGRIDILSFFDAHHIPHEFHYIDVPDPLWKERIEKRNRAVLAGEVSAYYVDEGLAAKFAARFEPPRKEEMDVWVAQ